MAQQAGRAAFAAACTGVRCRLKAIAAEPGHGAGTPRHRPSLAPATAGQVPVAALPDDVILTSNEDGRGRELKEIESDAIRLSLERCKGQMSEAARQLGIGRSTLYRKVRQYGLDEYSVD